MNSQNSPNSSSSEAQSEKYNENSELDMKYALLQEKFDTKIASLKEISQEKIDGLLTIIDSRITSANEKITKDRIELIRFFVPTIITTFVSLAIILIGREFFANSRFGELEQEIRKEVNEFTGKTADKPNLALLGLNGKPLAGQTIKVNKVFIINRAPNSVLYNKPRYSFERAIVVRNDGKGLIKSENSSAFAYDEYPSDTGSDDSNFSNFSYLPIDKESPITKIGFGKSVPLVINTTTVKKPEPGKKEKMKYKVVYGDNEVESIFYIEFSKDLKFENFDKP